MWGGPPRYAEKHGSGLVGTQMLSLHASPSRMTYTHACTWLDYMNAAVMTVYGENESEACSGTVLETLFGLFSND